MKILNILKASAFAMLAFTTINMSAGNIDANEARAAASKFLKNNSTTKFMAIPSSAVELVHAEASKVDGNAYYVFNIDGGGWVIIAGDDRAKTVLAYGDKGDIDMNNMPGGMKSFLNSYKEEIEAVQAYKGEVVPVKASQRTTVVEPLLKTDWGQSEPMNRYCPMNGNKRTSVGCAPLAMAQIMYYWKYPEGSPAMSGYNAYPGVGNIPALEATTFEYNLMLDTYVAIDPETGKLVLGEYTSEQAYAVAKLCRYCGQSCKSRYGNADVTGTGTYTHDQLAGFKFFGFNSEAQLIGKSPSYYCDNYGTSYTHEEWTALIYTELEANRPIPYHDVYEGHAWVLDGVDADGKFHMNWGFDGRFNGWFELNALIIYPYGDSEVWDFSQGGNGGHEMIIGMYPYDGYVIPGEEPSFILGDVNNDEAVNITDVLILINYLSNGITDGINMDAANYDQTGDVNISDVTALINYISTSAN